MDVTQIDVTQKVIEIIAREQHLDASKITSIPRLRNWASIRWTA